MSVKKFNPRNSFSLYIFQSFFIQKSYIYSKAKEKKQFFFRVISKDLLRSRIFLNFTLE